MSELDYQTQAQSLARKLWEIANDLRGSMDAAKFKNYILGTIFYRYLSERTEQYMNKLLTNDNITYDEAVTNPAYSTIVFDWSMKNLGYVIEPKHLFRTLVQKIQAPASDADKFSIEDYENAITTLIASTIGQDSEATFAGLFDDLRLQDKDLGRTVTERTKLIAAVITKVNELEFNLADTKLDILGTAYMQLIGLFASDAGSKAGEFFTPTGPAKLVATLATIGLSEAKTVGDCTCGSASMLLEVQKHLSAHKVGHFYGQEKNASTYNLARMNMLMHGVNYHDFTIYNGDTLTEDYYDKLKLTVQVCNPPYSLNYNTDEPSLKNDQRYKNAGKLPTKADLVFVEHMIYHMDHHDGRIAVLLPHGILFRGIEKAIRKYIIQKLNYLDAVIGLPENLFYGTTISVCLLVLKANRSVNKDNILFIDASREFYKIGNKNALDHVHIDKIVDAYIKRDNVDQFAYVAPLKEIEANDFNLNISRYINITEAKQEIDLAATRAELNSIASDKQIAISKVDSMLAQLGL